MLEFFASWCGYCARMEKTVLTLENVQKKLSRITTIRVDVSDQSEDQVQIMKTYGIGGTPALVFINSAGAVDTTLYLSDNLEDELLSELKRISR